MTLFLLIRIENESVEYDNEFILVACCSLKHWQYVLKVGYTIFRDIFGSILAQIMACCLAAPEYYYEPMLVDHKLLSAAFPENWGWKLHSYILSRNLNRNLSVDLRNSLHSLTLITLWLITLWYAMNPCDQCISDHQSNWHDRVAGVYLSPREYTITSPKIYSLENYKQNRYLTNTKTQ